jgi:hypothetical protein
MRLGVVPEDLMERLALLSGILPPGIFECWFGIMLSRTVMAATRFDIFESLVLRHFQRGGHVVRWRSRRVVSRRRAGGEGFSVTRDDAGPGASYRPQARVV